MKVLLVSGTNSRNSGGLYNSVRNLGQSLKKINEVEPILLAHSDEHSVTDIAAYAPLAVEDYEIIGPSGYAFSTNISKKIEQINPDILHPQCLWIYPSYATLKYHRINKTPYMVSARGMLDKWILNNNAWKKKLVGSLYEKEYLRNAACLNALALPEYEAMRAFGCQNPIAVIPNGVNLPAETWPTDVNIPEWKTGDNRKVMLFLSRLHPKKGIENLMKAWGALGLHKGEWKLAIAGESKESSYLQNLISLRTTLKLENDIFFIGPQFHKEKDVCFRCADAFILPSFSEGLPMAILEAWSYRLPVIMTTACNVPEGFENNAALQIEPDSDSILMALKELFDMGEKNRNTLGENGYQLVKDKFTWGAIAIQTYEVYKWILSGGEQPSTIKND
jgi:poly(glycerol-phosphate) alpha-glucosyltransferase